MVKWWFLFIFFNLKFFKCFYIVNLDNSDCFLASAANHRSFFLRRYSSIKVRFWPKMAKSGVQRSLYISRTVNGIKHLIQYSESTENFLSWPSHQILAYLSSSGRKFAKFDMVDKLRASPTGRYSSSLF